MSLSKELRAVVVGELSLDEGSVAAQGAQRLLEACLPDLQRATEATGVKVDAEAQTKSHRLWRACFLFIAKRIKLGEASNADAPAKEDSCISQQPADVERTFTITQLLRACDVSFVEFARELRHILARVKPKILAFAEGSAEGSALSLDAALEMSELSMDFCHVSALFSKYKDKFQHLFTSESEAQGAIPPSLSPKSPKAGNVAGLGGSEGSSEWDSDPWFKLGWLAFVTCKAKLLPKFPDLVSCASLLVCVLNFLLAHVPPSRLRNPLNDAVAYPVRTATGATYTLGCVAFLMHAHLQDAQKLMPRVDDLLNSLLSKDPVIERYELVVDAVIMTGCGNYKGLLAIGAAERQLEIMDKAYDQAYRLGGELDARHFALAAKNKAGVLGNSAKMTPRLNKSSPLNSAMGGAGGARQVTGSPMAAAKENRNWAYPSPFRRNGAAGQHSPALLKRVTPPTPISEALAASQWLRKAVELHMDRKSANLNRIFAACAEKSKEDVKQRLENFVQDLADKILPAVGSPLGKRKAAAAANGSTFTSEAEKRKREGIALYFHILEAMLVFEEKRAGPMILLSLLLNKDLHVSLVAFAFEVLSDCYKMTALSFPTVLNRLGISAFDLCKVIEPLVKAEVNLNLPKEVKRHLYAIEETSLESLSWERGSPFYKDMVACRGGQATNGGSGGSDAANQGDAASDGAPSASAFQKVHPLPKAFGRPIEPASGESGHKKSSSEKTLEEFLRKVRKLATFRMIDLTHRLERDLKFRKKEGDLVDAGLILDQAIALIDFVIYDQTRILYNRHVDQVVLCTLYGVAKVNQCLVTFREIVHHYMKQTQCKQEVYRAVVLKQSYPDLKTEQVGDIIQFYNSVFVPACQNQLLNGAARSNGSSQTDTEDKTTSASVSVSSMPKSPLRVRTLPDSARQEYLLASPSSHSLFTFIGTALDETSTPTKRWEDINTKIAGHSQSKKRLKL